MVKNKIELKFLLHALVQNFNGQYSYTTSLVEFDNKTDKNEYNNDNKAFFDHEKKYDYPKSLNKTNFNEVQGYVFDSIEFRKQVSHFFQILTKRGNKQENL